jgi:hypothetical protein
VALAIFSVFVVFSVVVIVVKFLASYFFLCIFQIIGFFSTSIFKKLANVTCVATVYSPLGE